MENEKLRIEYASPMDLKPNPWNTNSVSPENEEKLDESIDRFGMFKPVLVRTLNDGTLEIIGGEHRAKAAHKKGFKEIPILNLGSLDDKRAKEIGLVDNGRYGADDAIALSELLGELGDISEISSFLPFGEAELESLFSASSYDFDELDADEEQMESMAPSVQRQQILRFKVPVEDAHVVTDYIERIIKEQGLSSSDSLTNAGDALIYLINHLRDEEK